MVNALGRCFVNGGNRTDKRRLGRVFFTGSGGNVHLFDGGSGGRFNHFIAKLPFGDNRDALFC